MHVENISVGFVEQMFQIKTKSIFVAIGIFN